MGNPAMQLELTPLPRSSTSIPACGCGRSGRPDSSLTIFTNREQRVEGLRAIAQRDNCQLTCGCTPASLGLAARWAIRRFSPPSEHSSTCPCSSFVSRYVRPAGRQRSTRHCDPNLASRKRPSSRGSMPPARGSSRATARRPPPAHASRRTRADRRRSSATPGRRRVPDRPRVLRRDAGAGADVPDALLRNCGRSRAVAA